MQLEICCYSLQSCINAQKGGANRIELCNGLFEGGTTPSIGLIKLTVEAVDIPIYPIIRPRGGDFVYSETELRVMEEDIRQAKAAGAKGVVIGILKPDGTVNISETKRLVELAKPLGVTFHRAFDMTTDPMQALEDIIQTGCERILTSGQQNYAADAATLLTKLAKAANSRIEIMAGSGVGIKNAEELIKTGVHAIHLSAKTATESPMRFRNEAVSMASAINPSEYVRYEANLGTIQEIKKIVKKLNQKPITES
jgi:copper homeostasis protein